MKCPFRTPVAAIFPNPALACWYEASRWDYLSGSRQDEMWEKLRKDFSALRRGTHCFGERSVIVLDVLLGLLLGKGGRTFVG